MTMPTEGEMFVRNITFILLTVAFLSQGCTKMKSDGPDSGFIRKTMDIDGQPYRPGPGEDAGPIQY